MISNFIFGLAGGLLTASWGAFKDTPYEGFSIISISFLRSLVVTCIFYLALLFFLSKTDFSFHHIAVLFSAIAFERLTQEYWKAFFRSKQRESIYKIPQSFHVLGKVLKYKSRFVIGLLLSTTTFVVLNLLFGVKITANSWIIPGVILSVLPSLGGAWKDAPIEGFNIKKFPRSFIIMFASIFLLSRLTNNLLVLIMGAAGLERLLVEFYKSFLILSTPGKYNQKIIYPDWIDKRKIFIASYAVSVVVVVVISLFIN